MMLGLLLARSGVKVLVLEKHLDLLPTAVLQEVAVVLLA